ncbi:hypothetical protein [Paenibacillus xylanilyticus]|uniref:Uncharacterized protein n=1 Tax=Paenibacillus xylanilyticus TaxID=248903 RepID=A0A7Y6EUB5_9BACL|nr:hypothetical protein [Paenibacillus xylanilyticus]NUU76927.1 hypothetical protein [Paenibacillus xylanilyticus]
MKNRVAGLINEWEGVSQEDLIELLKEKDQALQAITDVNYQLSCERDLFRREADHYKARCVKFQVDEMRRKRAGGEIK